MLKDLGYEVVSYFYNPNIFPSDEYNKRLNSHRKLCNYFGIELIEGEYNTEAFYSTSKGLEQEPEKGVRCNKCFELRLLETAKLAKNLNINEFTTTIVISPHKNFAKLTLLGENIAKEIGINYKAIDFKKQDGFLKSNQISKELDLYRQNYCGCEFSIRK